MYPGCLHLFHPLVHGRTEDTTATTQAPRRYRAIENRCRSSSSTRCCCAASPLGQCVVQRQPAIGESRTNAAAHEREPPGLRHRPLGFLSLRCPCQGCQANPTEQKTRDRKAIFRQSTPAVRRPSPNELEWLTLAGSFRCGVSASRMERRQMTDRKPTGIAIRPYAVRSGSQFCK